ncbi:MAG TPA: four helix bundle protein [Gemmatimonadaceae bacterium]|jgi:four helix bundle protein
MTNPPPHPSWDLKDLVAWQVALDFATETYRTTRRFPSDERFGLRLQLRRAAVSVASNIAEGHGRSSKREFVRYALIARGSLKEAETQIILSARLNFLNTSDSQHLLELSARINKLITGSEAPIATMKLPGPISDFPFPISAVMRPLAAPKSTAPPADT